MSPLSTVQDHLRRRFTDHRVVFWHDPEAHYSPDLDSLELQGVIAIRVANDEYAIKYRLLHEEPKQRFLIYRSGQVPTGIDNWLLDLELAYGVFTADRESLIAEDLGLTAEGIDEVVQSHEGFFNASKRVQALKSLLDPDDDAMRLRAKMSAVALNQREHSLLEITRTLLSENAKGRRTKYDALAQYNLDDFYWQGVASIYGYESASPSIDDFILWIFRQALAGFSSNRSSGLHNIKLDFDSLRNDRRSQAALAVLAQRAARDLDYAASIEDSTFRDLVDAGLFEETDQKIISDLADAIVDQTVTAREVGEVVRSRQSSLWIDGYQHHYTALATAADLLSALGAIELAITSFDDALERYRGQWFRIDQLYRQFMHAYRRLEGSHPLGPLRDQVEKHYTNKFVYELGNSWQQAVDATEEWTSSTLRSQRSFYRDYVAGLLREDKKAVVIISDALRYEVAEELRSRIRHEDRFDAELEAVLGVLPSYTQLGMAALLPHHSLKHSPDGKVVLADDQPTNGTAFRRKVLEAVGGTAVQAEEFRDMNQDERRELFRNHRVLYIYHDAIDAIGDKPATERGVFEAAERALGELVELAKKAANANATNIFITADHGFLFQEDALPDQFYLSVKPQGDEILVTNRRYVLGHGLKVDQAFSTFTSVQLDLDSDLEVQIPKSIQRLRLAGGGSRFVHGGATLQEVVLPVLSINKKRRSDTRLVNVEVLPETDKITTGQLVVRLFQKEAVSEKIQARTLRAGLYVGETLISNDPQPQLVFDSPSTDPRDRYQSVQLLLGKESNDFNNRLVELRIEEPIPNTNQWRAYTKAMYTLKRSFTSDFDF